MTADHRFALLPSRHLFFPFLWLLLALLGSISSNVPSGSSRCRRDGRSYDPAVWYPTFLEGAPVYTAAIDSQV